MIKPRAREHNESILSLNYNSFCDSLRSSQLNALGGNPEALHAAAMALFEEDRDKAKANEEAEEAEMEKEGEDKVRFGDI